jgi:ABC-type transport system involved in multi-copper enzyme maturation permease subunit
MLTLMVASFPFALEEKNDINTLYVTQKIPRKTVVYGRFIYGILISLIFVVFSIVIDVAVMFVIGNTTGIVSEFFIAAVVFIGLQLFNAFRFPFFFKYGYAKGNVVASIVPMFIIIGCSLLIAYLKPDLTAIPKFGIEAVITVIAAIIVFIVISITLSVKFYQKREF